MDSLNLSSRDIATSRSVLCEGSSLVRQLVIQRGANAAFLQIGASARATSVNTQTLRRTAIFQPTDQSVAVANDFSEYRINRLRYRPEKHREDTLNTTEGTAHAEWKRHWPLVIATASGMALAGMLSSVFGVLLEPMQRDLGWTRAEISTGPVVVSLMGLFLAAPAGYLIDRLGSRVTGLIVVATTFLAIMAMSQVGDQLWHWWAAWSIFGIAGAFTSTVFSKGRGMAIALTISGASVSAALSPPIAEYFIQHYSWRMAFVALGILWCGLLLPLVLAFVPGRRAMQAKTDAAHAAAGTENRPANVGGFTPREGFRSRNFWLIFL
ncbi:MAG: MFS transporter, partial [Hyphomicrobiales bacterium]